VKALNKTKFALIIMLLLCIGLTVNFVAFQNGKIASINRLIPLNIPKHATVLNYHYVDSTITAVFQIDTSANHSFWRKYYSDDRTVVDVNNESLNKLIKSIDSKLVDQNVPCSYQHNCERGVIYSFCACESKDLFYVQLRIPDWKTNPDCEKLFFR
jgi:hypothetical protein